MTDRMREVELVEGVDEPTPLHPDGSGAPTSTPGTPVPDGVLAARSWLRRNARWLVPTAAVVVLAVVGTQVVADARERSRLEALAAIPGVVPPTGPDIGVIWRADASLATVMQGGTAVGGLLVGGRPAGTKGFELVALDTDTGELRWTTPVELPTAHVSPGGSQPSSWVGCAPLHHDDRELAGCVSQQYGDDVVGLPDSATWVVDPADGSIVSHVVVPGGDGVAFTSHARVVADRIAADGDGPAPVDASSVRWKTTAADVVSGATLWTYTTPVVAVPRPEDGLDVTGATGDASLQAFDDQLVLQVDTRAWILGEDGTLVRDVPLDRGTWIEGARSGVFIESSYTSADTYDGKLLLADGTSVPISESAGWLSVDDGSAPDVVFTVGQGPTGAAGFSARDTTNGEVLWHRDDPVSAGLLLDGVLYICTEQAVEAVDARTGRTRWSTPAQNYQPQLSTDGRYLLVPGPSVTLQAYALSDGRLAWTKDLMKEVAGDRGPTFVQGFQSMWHDPRLYVWMDDGAVAVLG
jgi:outer membrane protein assembly factor BamB